MAEDGGASPTITGRLLEDVRVVEVASWTFVPSAGAVLADWGADVIKVEHPRHGDPQRGLMMSGMLGNAGESSVNFIVETPNRSKRSIGIDLVKPAGVQAFHRLVATADVFLTNMMSDVRQKLGLEVGDLREVNPHLIYARGHGLGVRGDEADRGGYDTTSFWARSGLAAFHTEDGATHPAFHSPALGDLLSGLALAGGVAAALAHRQRTGVARIVDVSLLNVGMWAMSPGIVGSALYDIDDLPRPRREAMINPLANYYRTRDGRDVSLVMLDSARYWVRFCNGIGRPDLAEDPRFATADLRARNCVECIAELDATFASRSLDEWRPVLEQVAVWGAVQTAREVHDDAQALANGYLPTLETGAGEPYRLVASPVQYDESPASPTRAPELGEHTEEVLLELGYSWEDIIELKGSDSIT
jgi:crotonobetainyl-CoA:carnitine CoA-transferase CaiB-like acyl-CoA transferase